MNPLERPRADKFSRLFLPGIYAILDGKRLSELLSLGKRLLAHPDILAVQVRAKCLAATERRRLIESLSQGLEKKSPPLVINDELSWAMELQLPIHLGQEDQAISEARKLCGPERLIGVSTHSLAQALSAARDGASYIGFGPMYPTTSKADALTPRSLSELCEVIQRVSIPVVAIGGLGPENLGPLLDAGARHFAMLSALHKLSDADIARLTREIRQRSAA
jgi:thiamine-phosphate diphosphorylase